MQPSQVKAPGELGTGHRTAPTEKALAEATACPFAMFDGTACHGPQCAHWRAAYTCDSATGEPLLARVDCAAYVKPRRIGLVIPQEGARP